MKLALMKQRQGSFCLDYVNDSNKTQEIKKSKINSNQQFHPSE